MKASDLAKDKRVHVAVLVVLAVWMLGIITARRLPYLETVFSRQLRGLVIFPVILVVLGWFTLLHKWAETGKSGYEMAMQGIGSRGGRLRQTVLGIAGAVAISAVIAWSSVAFPAWATQVFARKPVALKARILEVKHASGGYTFRLWDSKIAEENSLFVSWGTYDRGRWREGDEICLRGRTWPFGVVIDSLNRTQDGCV